MFVTLSRFNSIKVRLRHLPTALFSVVNICFNSIKVRLRHTNYKAELVRYVFQFHKGTIKTDR